MIKIFSQSIFPLFVNIFSLFFLLYVSKILTSTDLAYYFININIFLVSGAIIQFGFSVSGIKLLEKFKERGFEYISDAIFLCFTIRLVLFIFSFLAYFLLTYFFYEYDIYIFLSWFIYIIANFFDFEFVFLFLKKLYLPYLFKLLAIISAILAITTFQFANFNDFLLIWSSIYFVTNIILIIYLKIFYGLFFVAPSRIDFLSEFRESFMYFSLSFIAVLCYKVPFFFIAQGSENRVINFYSLFEKINESFKIFIQYLARFEYQSLLNFKNDQNIKKVKFIIKSSLSFFIIIQLIGLIAYNSLYQHFSFIPDIINNNRVILFLLPIFSLIAYHLISLGLNKISIKYGFFTLLKLNLISFSLINLLWFFPMSLSILSAILLVLIVDISIVSVRHLFLLRKQYENNYN